MKIRQIEIKDFGAIKNKTLKFTSGLNVLYDENGQVRGGCTILHRKNAFW